MSAGEVSLWSGWLRAGQPGFDSQNGHVGTTLKTDSGAQQTSY
jgi:hypothetical protein